MLKFIIPLFALFCVIGCDKSNVESAPAPAAEQATATEQASLNVSIEGMSCNNCVQGITKTMLDTPGVSACEVSLDEKSGAISYDAEKVSPEAIVAGINKMGFQAAVK